MHVIDANVFIHGSSRELPFDDPATVPAVTAELESSDARVRYDVESVPVYAPPEDAVAEVRDAADDLEEDLSDADVQVLALALDRSATVVSDDYGVQNTAAALDIDYEGFTQEEITEEVEWRRVCEDCGREVDADRCPTCGGDVTRVPR